MAALAVTLSTISTAVVPPKNDKHSWSVANFETHRPLLTNFLKEKVVPLIDSDECHRVLIRAPVKSGKREMVEYLAQRDHAHCPLRVHAFISSFHRVADEDQRNELRNHNMRVFSLKAPKDANECNDWINRQLRELKKIVIHIDECDFGAGEKQIMSKVYKNIREDDRISVILYSATPQEVIFSGEVNFDEGDEGEEYNEMVTEFITTGEIIEYVPPESFCGPKTFLESNLVIEAKPFFKKNGSSIVLTEQGRSIIEEVRSNALANNGRNIVVLRLSYSELGGSRKDKKDNKAITQFARGIESIAELSDFLIFMDKSDDKNAQITSSLIIKEKIHWSSSRYWRSKTRSEPILVVIDQTSSRSTEWCCHDRVSAYHDFRNSVVFSTVSQAQERVNHYSTKYGGFQPIKVYGHRKTFLLSAGDISYDDYLNNNEWKMKKIDRRNPAVAHLPPNEPRYAIVSTNCSSVKHPNYPNPLTENEANLAVQDIGCSAEVRLSSRVCGRCRTVPVYKAEFKRCQETEWSLLKEELDARFGKSFQNPFTKSVREGLQDGKYKGFLRGWKVFDFDRDIVPQPGWGVTATGPRLTICYKNDVLGVAVKYDTKTKKTVNNLETFKSMYNNTEVIVTDQSL